MKIAQVTAVFPPYKGGMGQVPYHFARELHGQGVDVEVVTPDYGKGYATCDFIVHYIKPFFAIGLGAVCPQLIWQLRKYDIVQLHYPAYGMALFVWLWKKIFGRKKKLFIFYHMDNVSPGLLGMVFKVYALLFRDMILRSADMIQVSTFDYAQHSNINRFFEKHRSTFIELPFGVTDEYKPGEKNIALLEKYNIDPNKKLILFVGGLGPASYFKGPDILIEAVSKLANINDNDRGQTPYKGSDPLFDPLHNWHLVFVGKGGLIPQYKKQAADLGIGQHVTFTDWQPDEVMPDWYRSAYVFVMPSIDSSEAFGIVYIEAMACGTPAIGTNLPGVRTVIEHEKTGYIVEPKNVQDLVKYLNMILQDEGTREQMAQDASQRVRENYQWRNIVKKLNFFYSRESRN